MLFKTNKEFNLTNNIIDELNITDLDDWPKYLVHRYRYEVYPDKKDEYPPYLQIEPSSICNYRCVFCFETDKVLQLKKTVSWVQWKLICSKI